MPAKLGLTPQKFKEKLFDVYQRNDNLHFEKVSWCYQFCFHKGVAPSRKDYINFISRSRRDLSMLPLQSETSFRDSGMTFCYLVRSYLSETGQVYEDLAVILYHAYLTGFCENTLRDIDMKSLKEIERRYSSVKFLDEYKKYKIEGGDNPFLIHPSYYEFIQKLKIDHFSFNPRVKSKNNIRNINEQIENSLQDRVKSFKKKLGSPQKVEFFEKLIEKIQERDCVMP